MSDISDSNPQAGAPRPPTPDASQNAGQPNSQTPEAMPEWFKPFAKEIEASRKIASSKQSEADKLRAAANKQGKQDYAKDIEPFVESATIALGLDENQVIAYRKQLLRDEVDRRVLSGSFQSEPASLGSGTEEVASVGEVDVLSKFQMSDTDPEVRQALQQADGDSIDLAYRLSQLREQRALKPQPNLASNAASLSGTSVTKLPVEQLVTEYIKKMAEARGNKTLAQNTKESYRSQGVPVDSVILSV